jgi:hypothetical protein
MIACPVIDGKLECDSVGCDHYYWVIYDCVVSDDNIIYFIKLLTFVIKKWDL